DCERGTENYDKLVTDSGSVVFQTTDIQEVIAEVKSLLTEKHDYRTLVIDPITTIYNDLLDKCEMQVGSDFGRHYGAANKTIKRRYDVNVLEKPASQVKLATPEQVKEIKELLSLVRLPEGTVDKWFAKAGVDLWEDMPSDTAQKCIDYVKGRLPTMTAA